MTNKEWLATLSPQEWYMAVNWLFHNYGRRYDNTYLAIIAWLEDNIEEVKPLPPTDESDLWRCGYCHHQIIRCTHQRFCEECGRKIGWEDKKQWK